MNSVVIKQSKPYSLVELTKKERPILDELNNVLIEVKSVGVCYRDVSFF